MRAAYAADGGTTPATPSLVSAKQKPSSAHRAALVLMWLAIASGAIVFTEPAPFDALMLGLALLLPAIGLARMTAGTAVMAALWLVVAAGGFTASLMAGDLAGSATHAAVTLFLSIACVLIAAFVAKAPQHHTTLVMNAYVCAGALAAACGIIGYFDLIPGTRELMTNYGRARGLFKDPNVFGPFLVPPLVYVLSRAPALPWYRALLVIPIGGLLALGVLLSFSRGAWINLALALGLLGVLTVFISRTALDRVRLASIALCGGLLALVAIGAVMQIDGVRDLLAERASLSQSYDVKPEGRFDGHAKALALAVAHPLGIGAKEFAAHHHPEDAHNVYYSMLLNAGWLGGLTYLALVVIILSHGGRHILHESRVRPLLVPLWCCFAAVAIEGVIIDTDHWRHFFVLAGLVMGLSESARLEFTARRHTVAQQRIATVTLRLPPMPDTVSVRTRRPQGTARPVCTTDLAAVRRRLGRQ
jgi:O-antigen ligase